MKLQLTIETWSDKEDSRLRLEGFDDTAGFDKRVFLDYQTIDQDIRVDATTLLKRNFPTITNEWIGSIIANANLVTFNKDEFKGCDGFENSNCCGSSLLGESDICGECGEHATTACEDCEDYDICTNENKI